MWTTEYTIETAASPDAFWRAWADVARWSEWNADIKWVQLNGPFAVGSIITMTPQDQQPVQLRLAEVVDGERFVDEADVAGTLVRTLHRIDTVDSGRARVTYRLEASGPGADQIGPAISSDFGDTLTSLVEYAGR
jgi:hypothetical protein